MSAFISDYFKDHPAEIQVDSTGLVEYSYKPTDVLIESLKFKFLSLPIEQRVKARLQDTQWLRYPEDVDEAARGLAMPSFENLDLVSEHKADRINYRYDTLVLTYAVSVDDCETENSRDFHVVKFWWDGHTYHWMFKVYVNYYRNSLSELDDLGINYTRASQYGVGFNLDDALENFVYLDEYFYLKGSDCERIWERLGFQSPSVEGEDNRGRGLFAITVKEHFQTHQREIVKLKRYYYPDDPRLEKNWK